MSTFSLATWLEQDHAGKKELQMTKPVQVGYYTKTSIRQGSQYLYGDKSGLASFQLPRLPVDLNNGYPHSFIRKPEGECTSVEVIIRGAQQAQLDLSRLHVCTFRNNLNKICSTPLFPSIAWAVDACWHNGTLFLDIVKQGGDNSFPNADLFTYYGYKFEAVCCTGSVDGDGGMVDATSEFATMVQFRLGSHVVLMSAEVDCMDPRVQQPDPLAAYLELKTYRLPGNAFHQGKLLRDKYPKWWLQSFLAGVPTLVLGGRDHKGVLREVRRQSVQKLPSESSAGGQAWDARQMLRFGRDMLGWMAGQAGALPGQHVRFEYDPIAGMVHSRTLPTNTLGARLAKLLPADSLLPRTMGSGSSSGALPASQQKPRGSAKDEVEAEAIAGAAAVAVAATASGGAAATASERERIIERGVEGAEGSGSRAAGTGWHGMEGRAMGEEPGGLQGAGSPAQQQQQGEEDEGFKGGHDGPPTAPASKKARTDAQFESGSPSTEQSAEDEG